MTLYIALDARQEAVPAWLSGYTKSNQTAVTSNDVTFNLYTKQIAKGETVTLGTNGGSYNLVNYTVMAKASALTGNAYVKNLQVNDTENSADWSLDENITTGSLLYGDREVTFAQLPTELQNTAAIRTACDSKNLDASLAVFTAGMNETIYILEDSRVTTIPEWLNQYTKTNLTAVGSNDVTFNVYLLKVAKGDTVILGTNGQISGCVNYTVLIKADAGTSSIIGDADANGTVEFADVVMLQKYLLKKGHLTDWKQADVCQDGIINIFDLIALKKLLMK